MENLISVEKGVFAEKDWKRGKELRKRIGNGGRS
jgi:hypothetical protein